MLEKYNFQKVNLGGVRISYNISTSNYLIVGFDYLNIFKENFLFSPGTLIDHIPYPLSALTQLWCHCHVSRM